MARLPKPSGNKNSFGEARSLANSRKPKGSRKYKKMIIIVVEGKETEVNYFSSLRSFVRNPLIKIDIIPGNTKTDSINICKRAITKLTEMRLDEKWEEDIDEIWVVLDFEALTNIENINKARVMCNRREIRLAISNPCFEYWFLLHFNKTDKPFKDGKELKTAIGTKIIGYHESMDVFKIIQDQTNYALENANSLRESNMDHWVNLENSSTEVDLLVAQICK